MKTYEYFKLSQCVSHDAVNSADTKDTQGCAATGCGAVDCARHEFRRANSLGDLQKGERWVSLSFLRASSSLTVAQIS